MRKLFESITKRWVATKKTVSSTRKTSALRNHLNGFEPLEQRQLLSVSEGLAAMNIDLVQDRFFPLGGEGLGVRVGVIADGYTTSTDLPTGTVTTGSLGAGSGTTGTAMLEVIDDIAPYANLYFAPATDATGFEAAVAYLTGEGVDVIVADSGIYNQPWFEDGDAADAVAAAISSGTIFVGAAGDDGELHYQDTFSQYSGGDYHDFGGSRYLAFDVSAGTVNVSLGWDNPWNAATSDYDLYLYGWSGGAWNYVTSSADSTGLTFESVSFDNSGSAYSQMAVAVRNPYLDASVTLELMIDGPVSAATSGNGGASIAYSAEDAIFGPSALESSITVGAVDYTATSWTSVTADSSRGGSTVSGTTRDSLDVVAMDHVTTTLGTESFVGTAASAAHVGGMAALAVQAADAFGWDGLTATELEGILRTTAIDIETEGYDNLSGAGLIDALEAAYYMYVPDAPTLDAGSDTGFSHSDLLTNDLTPTFTGAVPLSSYVELQIDFGGTWYTVAADTADAATGAYSLTFDADAALYGLLGVHWSPAFDGSYNLRVGVASSSEGTIYEDNWSDTTTVTIDTAAPTAAITAISPDPRDTVVSDVEITFDELVYGLTVADLSLTLGSTSVAITGVTATPDDATLTTSYDLSDFTSLTGDIGTYELTLLASGGVTDEAGNSLLGDASDSWDMYDIVGTSGDDVFFVTTDGVNHSVTVNGGTPVSYPASGSIRLHGGDGTDTLYIYDSSGDDTFTADPKEAVMEWGTGGNATANGFETVNGYSSGDAGDTATLNDSAGSDLYFGYASYGLMMDAGSTYRNYAFSFATITGNASNAGDVAYLYDSAGVDTFEATLDGPASMTRTGASTSEANGFATVYGYGTVGGSDEVILHGSAGADLFYGYETSSLMKDSGNNYASYAYNFATTTGNAAGDGDIARLYGSAGLDTFEATLGGPASMTRTGSSTSEVDGFATVYGYGTAGGSDIATLNGSADADLFYGYETYSLMKDSGGNFVNYAYSFSTTTGNASGTGDVAYLFDSAGLDEFEATLDGSASMTRTGSSTSEVTGFAAVYGYGTAGGSDTAILNDSAGSDLYFGYASYGLMMDAGSTYRNYAFNFATITGNASNAGDVAYLYDSAGVDTFEATLDGPASMTRTGASTSEANGFATVYGYGTVGGSDEVILHGSAGADLFYGYETSSLMKDSGNNYASYAYNFATTTGNAAGDGDIARLYGSAGLDTFEATLGGPASMTRTGSSTSEVDGFATVYGYGTAGGSDIATLNGSADADLFYGYETYSLMKDSGGNFVNYAYSFSTTTGNASGTGDVAYLFDSAGLDEFEATLDGSASMTRTGSSTSEVTGFAAVYGYGTAGGSDTAILNDSAGSDLYFGYASYGLMMDAGSAYRNYAFNFATITGNASNAGDVAYLYDSAGVDTFEATLDGPASMTRTGASTSEANGFATVYGYGTVGGSDEVILHGSAGADLFYGYETSSLMKDSGNNYASYAYNFATTTGNAAGDGDIARLYGSAGLDTFEATLGVHASMTRTGSSTTEAEGFATVYGYGTVGGADTAMLFDSLGADMFYSYETYSLMTDAGNNYANFAFNFLEVSGVSSGAGDFAYLYDSSGADVLFATPDTASMSLSTGKTTDAEFFERVYANFSNDGDDFIDMLADPDVVNRFSGSAGQGLMTDDSTYWIYLLGLDDINDVVQIDGGDGDITPGDDILQDNGVDYDLTAWSW